MMSYKNEKGSMTLETALILTLFFFLFMSIFGFFGFIAARNQIHHALIQSTKSLSLDSYVVEKSDNLGSSNFHWWESISDMALDLWRAGFDQNFTSRTDWYSKDSNTDVVKNRFVAYFAGSGNDKDAQKRLERIGVKDGLKGIEFKYQVVDGDLKVTIKYNLHLWIDIFGIGNFPMEDTAIAKMWGYDESSINISDNDPTNVNAVNNADDSNNENYANGDGELNDNNNNNISDNNNVDDSNELDDQNNSGTSGDNIADGDNVGNDDLTDSVDSREAELDPSKRM